MDVVWIRVIAAAVIAYFCGCFNGAVIVSKYILRKKLIWDARTGRWLLVGHLPALAMLMNSPEQAYSDYWCGLFCLLGHMFPCMFQFKGGKGILSGGTIIIMIDWRVALVGWGGFVLLFLLTRYVSLGSSSTGIDLPIVTWFVYRDWVLLVLICIMGGLILWKHRSNIARLISGTESKFSFHRKAAG